MKLIAFLQLKNEHEQGNLVRCLDNLRQYVDEIFIADDNSTDGSQEIYLKYTKPENLLLLKGSNFTNELFIKKELLALALKSNPDWICWIDGDTTLSRDLTRNCKTFLEEVQGNGHDGVYLHNLNLWRHESFARLDNQFNDLYHMVFWKNNGFLKYKPVPGLHMSQFPQGISNPFFCRRPDQKLLHYGFSSELKIIRKYLQYKSLGQAGWSLDRLIDEQSSFQLARVPESLYPEENIPLNHEIVEVPSALTYNNVRVLNSFQEYQLANGK